MNNKKGLCLIGLAALLVSCGGGGGGGSTTNTPTPTPTNPTVTKKEDYFELKQAIQFQDLEIILTILYR